MERYSFVDYYKNAVPDIKIILDCIMADLYPKLTDLEDKELILNCPLCLFDSMTEQNQYLLDNKEKFLQVHSFDKYIKDFMLPLISSTDKKMQPEILIQQKGILKYMTERSKPVLTYVFSFCFYLILYSKKLERNGKDTDFINTAANYIAASSSMNLYLSMMEKNGFSVELNELGNSFYENGFNQPVPAVTYLAKIKVLYERGYLKDLDYFSVIEEKFKCLYVENWNKLKEEVIFSNKNFLKEGFENIYPKGNLLDHVSDTVEEILQSQQSQTDGNYALEKLLPIFDVLNQLSPQQKDYYRPGLKELNKAMIMTLTIFSKKASVELVNAFVNRLNKWEKDNQAYLN